MFVLSISIGRKISRKKQAIKDTQPKTPKRDFNKILYLKSKATIILTLGTIM